MLSLNGRISGDDQGMTTQPHLTILPLTPDRLPDLAALFEQGGDPKWCWCAYFRVRSFDFSKGSKAKHRSVLEGAAADGAAMGRAPGLVAYEGTEAVGWISIGPRDDHERLVHSRVLAPIDGEIETQIVAIGDYVKVGDPLFKLVGVQELRVHLLLPEAAAMRIRPGLKVVLSTPAAPDKLIEAAIDEIKPTLGVNNRALDAIVKLRGEGTALRGGGTVNARIVTSVVEGALMVPEQSVVLRPAGKVVYVLEGSTARQRVVETGLRQDGWQQIVKGLNPGDTVAADGAGFLTDGAAIAQRGARGGEKGTAQKNDRGAGDKGRKKDQS